MKKNLMPILLLAAGSFLYSCKKSDTLTSAVEKEEPSIARSVVARDTSDREDDCIATVVSLMAGQNIDAGTVTVENDDSYIYVTYSTANGYTLKETHLYVGDCALIPVNRPGNPIPGQFPYNATHSNITTYTVAVPISAIPLGGCGCVAAHAVVQKLGASGQVLDTQTGWGDGTLINSNGSSWGMKFEYCSCQALL